MLATALALAAPAFAQGNADEEPCPGGGYDPTPVEVAVTTVPIVVASTPEEYFVLYVRHDLDADTTVEVPVAVTLGEAGTTTLAENVVALPAERYRVEKYLVADPADVDGDCIDDLTELGNPVGMNPVNPAAGIDLSDGALAVPDRETFETISIYLRGKSHVKFLVAGLVAGMDTDRPRVYFMNTKTHWIHPSFWEAVGLECCLSGMPKGEITYHPELVAPDGSPGVYGFLLRDYNYPLVDLIYTILAASMPLLEDNLAYYVSLSELPAYQRELALYEKSRINLLFDEDIFRSLNPGEGYGLLRVMEPGERPNPRDVVVYEALPNELPRVAGIISTVPQTPLSHVNLRAVQDGIPNAFIRNALDKPYIDDLLGGFVRYEVTDSGWDLRAATLAARSRPTMPHPGPPSHRHRNVTFRSRRSPP